MDLNSKNLKILLSPSSSLGEKVLGFSDDKTYDEQGVDSLDTLDFLLKIEESYGVNIPDDEIDQVNTINKMIAYLEKRI